MVQIHQQECLTVPEVASLIHIDDVTLYRWIKNKKCEAFSYSNQWYITKRWVDTHLSTQKQQKPQVVITKKDLTTDPWLKQSENLAKLKDWNQSKYIHWSNMQLLDYIAYYRYIIKPIWLQENPSSMNYPTNKWLCSHQFVEFKNSFQDRYLKSEGIETLGNFWEYLKNHKIY